jgi:hypothetical protein
MSRQPEAAGERTAGRLDSLDDQHGARPLAHGTDAALMAQREVSAQSTDYTDVFPPNAAEQRVVRTHSRLKRIDRHHIFRLLDSSSLVAD